MAMRVDGGAAPPASRPPVPPQPPAPPSPAPAPAGDSFYHPPSYSPQPQQNYSGSNDNGGGGGGGTGGTYNPPPSYNSGGSSGPTMAPQAVPQTAPVTPVAPPAPTTQTISIPDPAADPQYQAQHAALAKMLSDYQNNQTLASNQYSTNYGDSLHKLGWQGDPAKGGFSTSDGGAYAQSMGDNTSDFASRGLGRSSAMADSVGMIGKQFGDQKAGLDRAQNDFNTNQAASLQQYQGQNAATDHSDLLNVIARIAAQKGVDLSQVTPGKVNNVTVPA